MKKGNSLFILKEYKKSDYIIKYFGKKLMRKFLEKIEKSWDHPI
jgi:hypothetical protein